MHHTVDVPPTEERYQPRPWQKPHRPNLTGTPGAHRPTGSTLAQGRRPKATGDYKAWNPGADAGSGASPGARADCAASPFPSRIPRVNRALLSSLAQATPA